MLALLEDLRRAGRTMVLTTHQRELAEPMADVVLTMQSGTLTTAETA
jgi:ABC-type multidrug transport system ATPase subunit